jgi:hypothetical protein
MLKLRNAFCTLSLAVFSLSLLAMESSSPQEWLSIFEAPELDKAEFLRTLYYLENAAHIANPEIANNKAELINLVKDNKIRMLLEIESHEKFEQLDPVLLSMAQNPFAAYIVARKKAVPSYVKKAFARLTVEQQKELENIFSNENLKRFHTEFSRSLFVSSLVDMNDIYIAHLQGKKMEELVGHDREPSSDESIIFCNHPNSPNKSELDEQIKMAQEALRLAPGSGIAQKCADYITLKSFNRLKQSYSNENIKEFAQEYRKDVVIQFHNNMAEERNKEFKLIWERIEKRYKDSCTIF